MLSTSWQRAVVTCCNALYQVSEKENSRIVFGKNLDQRFSNYGAPPCGAVSPLGGGGGGVVFMIDRFDRACSATDGYILTVTLLG
jgi:hypothetical protein